VRRSTLQRLAGAVVATLRSLSWQEENPETSEQERSGDVSTTTTTTTTTAAASEPTPEFPAQGTGLRSSGCRPPSTPMLPPVRRFGDVGVGPGKWSGAVLGADGCVYFTPWNAHHVLRLNPEDLTTVEFGSEDRVPTPLSAATVAAQRRADPAASRGDANEWVGEGSISAIGKGGAKWTGGVLMPHTGLVVACPHSARSSLLIDTKPGSWDWQDHEQRQKQRQWRSNVQALTSQSEDAATTKRELQDAVARLRVRRSLAVQRIKLLREELVCFSCRNGVQSGPTEAPHIDHGEQARSNVMEVERGPAVAEEKSTSEQERGAEPLQEEQGEARPTARQAQEGSSGGGGGSVASAAGGGDGMQQTTSEEGTVGGETPTGELAPAASPGTTVLDHTADPAESSAAQAPAVAPVDDNPPLLAPRCSRCGSSINSDDPFLEDLQVPEAALAQLVESLDQAETELKNAVAEEEKREAASQRRKLEMERQQRSDERRAIKRKAEELRSAEEELLQARRKVARLSALAPATRQLLGERLGSYRERSKRPGEEAPAVLSSPVASPEEAVGMEEDEGPPAEVGPLPLCVACLDEPSTHALAPCGHKCLCEACTGSLFHRREDEDPPLCPICRMSTRSSIRIYDAH